MAAKLIEAGVSQRQAAKVLGVGLGTVQRDLTQGGSKSDPERVTKAERRAQRELDLANKQTALPNQRYGVIVADP
jgi:transposase